LPVVEHPGDLVAIAGYGDLTLGLLWAGHNRLLIALALAAGLYGVAYRRRAAAELIGWGAILVLLANPVLVGLPYSWLTTNDIVVISLFLPVGLLLGGGACWLVESMESRSIVGSPLSVVRSQVTTDYGQRTTDNGQRCRNLWLRAGIIVVLAALALWGAWDM